MQFLALMQPRGLYGVGKGAVLRKLRSDSAFKEAAYVFSRQSSLEEIVAAGEKALCCLYGGRPNEGLDVLRYRHFCEKVATSNITVQVQSLPPTSAAARYHSARVYLQVQQWMRRGKNLNPLRRLEMVKNSRPASCAHY